MRFRDLIVSCVISGYTLL